MRDNKTYLGKSIYMAAFLMLGCSGSAGGCGGSASGPTVDSELLGIYQIDRYQGSQDGCDEVSDIDGASGYVVLYSFRPTDNPDEPLLAGTFCSSVDVCREVAQAAPEPTIGYLFREGNDETGWRGWGIAGAGSMNDQCRVEVQVHDLTSNSADVIGIDTRTFETVFPPAEVEGNDATCSKADALASLSPDLPCQAIIVLEATYEAGL